MNSFLLTHSNTTPAPLAYAILNNTRAVITWVSPFPYVAIVVSSLTLNELTAVLRTHFGNTWFLLIEATRENTNGLLPGDFWQYINNPLQAVRDKFLAEIQKSRETTPGTLPPPPPRLAPSPENSFPSRKKTKD